MNPSSFARENLYRQAQVFLDASRAGAPLRVTAQGDLRAAGLGRRVVESFQHLALAPSQRQAVSRQRNREVVSALMVALQEAWPAPMSLAMPRLPEALGRVVTLLDTAYAQGQLPAARAFVDALGQALQPPTLISASSSALIQV